MPNVTISGADQTALVHYLTTESAPYAGTLAAVISAGLTDGSLLPYPYVSGSTAPGPAGGVGGVVIFAAAPPTTVAIPTTDLGVVIRGTGQTSITGGAPGGFVMAGSGG